MTFGKRKTTKRPTEVVIIHMLVVYTASPILPHAFDLEDGFLAGGVVEIDALGCKFMNGANVRN